MVSVVQKEREYVQKGNWDRSTEELRVNTTQIGDIASHLPHRHCTQLLLTAQILHYIAQEGYQILENISRHDYNELWEKYQMIHASTGIIDEIRKSIRERKSTERLLKFQREESLRRNRRRAIMPLNMEHEIELNTDAEETQRQEDESPHNLNMETEETSSVRWTEQPATHREINYSEPLTDIHTTEESQAAGTPPSNTRRIPLEVIPIGGQPRHHLHITSDNITQQLQRTYEGRALLPVREISELDEYLTKALEDSEYLITQQYIDPETQQLYEVMDTYLDRYHQAIYTTARPVDAMEEYIFDPAKLQHRPTRASDNSGTIDLIRLHAQGSHNQEELPWVQHDSQEWIEALNEDPFCKQILDRIGNENTIIFEHSNKNDKEKDPYFYRTLLPDGQLGALMRRHHREANFEHLNMKYNTRKRITQTVVPRKYKNQCIILHHEHLGHPGRSKTSQAIQSSYYWPLISSTIKRYCRQCHYCRKRKANYRVAKVPIMEYARASRPFSRCHCDLTGPFPMTGHGNQYILLFKDAMTKWIEIIALSDKTAHEVITSLVDEVFMRYGAPRELITDRGTEFTNKTMPEVLQLLGETKFIHTTPANPRSNGEAENQMRTLKDMLASFTNEFQNDWDCYLQVVARAYRTTINDATGFTPFFLMHGFEANTPDEEFTKENQSITTYAKRLREALVHTWETVGDRVIRNVATFNRTPSKPLKYVPFKVGEYFMLKRIPHRFFRSKKQERKAKIAQSLQMRWCGPYMITEVISPVLFGAIIHGKSRRVHATRMKHA